MVWTGRTSSYQLYVGLRLRVAFQTFMLDPTDPSYIQQASIYEQKVSSRGTLLFPVFFLPFCTQPHPYNPHPFIRNHRLPCPLPFPYFFYHLLLSVLPTFSTVPYFLCLFLPSLPFLTFSAFSTVPYFVFFSYLLFRSLFSVPFPTFSTVSYFLCLLYRSLLCLLFLPSLPFLTFSAFFLPSLPFLTFSTVHYLTFSTVPYFLYRSLPYFLYRSLLSLLFLLFSSFPYLSFLFFFLPSLPLPTFSTFVYLLYLLLLYLTLSYI